MIGLIKFGLDIESRGDDCGFVCVVHSVWLMVWSWSGACEYQQPQLRQLNVPFVKIRQS